MGSVGFYWGGEGGRVGVKVWWWRLREGEEYTEVKGKGGWGMGKRDRGREKGEKVRGGC